MRIKSSERVSKISHHFQDQDQMTMKLLKPWRRKGAAKVQPSETPHKILEKQSSDSDETTPLWQSDSTLSFLDSISSLRSTDDVKEAVAAAIKVETKPCKKVSFDTVEERQYGLIVGDSPDIDDGFPLMLDWKYNKVVPVSVDVHQERRTGGPSAGRIEELDVYERRLRLRAMGFTEAQLRLAERRRRIHLSLEWAYGMNKKNTPPFLNDSFVNHYVK